MPHVSKSAGSVRQLKSGRSAGKWQATARIGEGHGARRVTKTFTRERDAKVWLTDVRTKNFAHGPAAEQTVAQAFDTYLDAKVLARNSVEIYTAARGHVVASGLGDVKLAKLKPSNLERFTTWLVRNGFASVTVNQYAGKLSTVLRFAAADGGLDFTPKAVRVAVHVEERPALEAAQVWALHDAAPDGFAPAILLGAFCGLRATEAAAVTVGDIDFTAGTVTVNKAVDNRGRYVKPKTPRSMRTIPIPPAVVAHLAPHRFRAADANLAVNFYDRRFTSPTFAMNFAEVAVDAKVDCTFHALRKFFATSQLAAGVNPKTVARYLGDTIEVMLRTYAQVRPEDADASRKAMAEVYAAVFGT